MTTRPYTSVRAARFVNSAPAFKPHVSQSQAERARGPIQPMESPHAYTKPWEGIASGLLIVFVIMAAAGWLS